MDRNLRKYGGRMVMTDGRPTVEFLATNDAANRRFQYRRAGEGGGIERRMLANDGRPLDNGSPWVRIPASDLLVMARTRGAYHPILDPLLPFG